MKKILKYLTPGIRSQEKIMASMKDRYSTKYFQFDPEAPGTLKKFYKENPVLLLIAHQLVAAKEQSLDQKYEKHLINLRDHDFGWVEEGRDLAQQKVSKLREALSKSYTLAEFIANYRKLIKDSKAQREQTKGFIRDMAENYKSSIENIVEGQREVAYDPNFRESETEPTVKERMEEFERKLRILLANFRNK